MILCNNEKLCKRIQQNYTNTLVTACSMKLEDKVRCMFFRMAIEKIQMKIRIMHFVYER